MDNTKKQGADAAPQKIYTLWHVYEGEYEFVASANTLPGLSKALTACIIRSRSMRVGDISLHRPEQIRMVREMMRNEPTVEGINGLLSFGEIEERDAGPGEEPHKLGDLGPLAWKCRSAVSRAIEANKQA